MISMLRNKDEICRKLLIYKSEIENQLNKKMKKLRTNRRVDYN